MAAMTEPVDLRSTIEALREDESQLRWMLAKFAEAPVNLVDDPTPVVHVQGPDTSSQGMEVVPIEDLADAVRGRDYYAARLAEVSTERDALRKALERIAAGPTYAPHEEPWGKAEALIALDRARRSASPPLNQTPKRGTDG
jgi:hypothetical protein